MAREPSRAQVTEENAFFNELWPNTAPNRLPFGGAPVVGQERMQESQWYKGEGAVCLLCVCVCVCARACVLLLGRGW